MAQLGFSSGVPNAMPAGGVGQKPYSSPQKRDKKKKDGGKTETAQNNSQDLLPANHENGQKDSAPYGKGDLVDILA